MSTEDIKNLSIVLAAVITLLSTILLHFMVRRKERLFETERQRFMLRQREADELHAEEMQRVKHEFDRDQAKLKFKYEEMQQHTQAGLDVWKSNYEAYSKTRMDAVLKLRTSVFTVFDKFLGMLQSAQRAEDHEIISSLSKCIHALTGLDEAIDNAKGVVRDELEADKLNRLRIIRKFFLRIILDLTRRKLERMENAPLFRRLEGRLLKHRKIAVRHLQAIIDEKPIAPNQPVL